MAFCGKQTFSTAPSYRIPLCRWSGASALLPCILQGNFAVRRSLWVRGTFFPLSWGKPQLWQWVYSDRHLLNHWCKYEWIPASGSDLGRGIGYGTCQHPEFHHLPDPICPSHATSPNFSAPLHPLLTLPFPSPPAQCRAYLLWHMWRLALVPANFCVHNMLYSTFATDCTGGTLLGEFQFKVRQQCVPSKGLMFCYR